jgi:hypothetical protein
MTDKNKPTIILPPTAKSGENTIISSVTTEKNTASLGNTCDTIIPAIVEKRKDAEEAVVVGAGMQQSNNITDRQKDISKTEQSLTALTNGSIQTRKLGIGAAASSNKIKASQQTNTSLPVNAALKPIAIKAVAQVIGASPGAKEKSTAAGAPSAVAPLTAPETNTKRAVVGVPSAVAPSPASEMNTKSAVAGAPSAAVPSNAATASTKPARAINVVTQASNNQALLTLEALKTTPPLITAQAQGGIVTSASTNTPLKPTFAITSQIEQIPQNILTLLQTFGPLTINEVSHNIPSTTQSIPAILNIMRVLNVIHFHEGLYYFHKGEVRGDTILPNEIVDLINDTNAEIGETRNRIELLKKELNQNVKIQNRARSAREFLKVLVAKYDGDKGIRGDPVYATALKTLNVDLGMKRKIAAAETAKKKRARKKRKSPDPPKQISAAVTDGKLPLAKSGKDATMSNAAAASSATRTSTTTVSDEIKVPLAAALVSEVPASIPKVVVSTPADARTGASSLKK